MTDTKTSESLSELDPQSEDYAVDFVDALLLTALRRSASDVHLQPEPDGIRVDLRVDGVLHDQGVFPRGVDSDPVVRLKVMADLLTYKTQTPQEGRLKQTPEDVEMRLSTFPTIHGERAVIRLFRSRHTLSALNELELPADICESLVDLCDARDGAILVTGPAGSGKTTTLYAALRRITSETKDRRSVLTIEDPVESALPGTSQSQLDPNLGMSLDAALRSMLRQDPEVVLVGEIRDPSTAEAALQASLTGHLIFSSFHAGNVGLAVRRLVEMKIAPYLIRSGVRAMISQRLLRRLCPNCQTETSVETGLPVDRAFAAAGCERCDHTGYLGRLPIAEILRLDDESTSNSVHQAIEQNRSGQEIYRSAIADGMVPLQARAVELINSGDTSISEVFRTLGSSAFAGLSKPH